MESILGTVLYKLNKQLADKLEVYSADTDLRVVSWRPSRKPQVSLRKGTKYFIYCPFHYLRSFKNSDYSDGLVYNTGNILASSLLIEPAYYK